MHGPLATQLRLVDLGEIPGDVVRGVCWVSGVVDGLVGWWPRVPAS